MRTGLRFWINAAGLALVLGAVFVLGLSAWIMSPSRLTLRNVLTTSETLLRAPFASSLVIGDSRVELAKEPDGALFAGIPSATGHDLARLARIACSVTDARVTVAAGINDTKPGERDLRRSRTAFEAIVENCRGRDLRIAEIWPAEPSVGPAGGNYDAEGAASLNDFLRKLAARKGIAFLTVPDLPAGYTIDGVHFSEPVSRDYARLLAFDRPG